MIRRLGPEGVPSDAVDISDDGGLCKKILVAGDASAGTPFDGAEVQVHYVGTLMDGSKFDSSRDRPGNFSFTIGQGQVIKGWDKGVATMHKGEKAELYCRSDYAYGDSGSPPKIPGGATLKFEVELLSWAKPKASMSAGEKIAEGKALKADATSKFKAGDFGKARALYDEAGTWVANDYDFIADADCEAAFELRVSCLLNSAQCSLKLADWPEAVRVCTEALEPRGETRLPEASEVKALFRRGSARIKMSDFDEARADLKKACTLDPKSREIREAYASIKEAEKAARQADAGLFAKMVKGAGGSRRNRRPGCRRTRWTSRTTAGCARRSSSRVMRAPARRLRAPRSRCTMLAH